VIADKGIKLLNEKNKSATVVPLRKTDDDYDEEEEEADASEATKKQAESPSKPPSKEPPQGSASADIEEAEAATRSSQGLEEGDEWEKQPAPKPKREAHRIRKNGLLLLSEMFVGPATQPRIARTRASKASHIMASKV